MDYFDSGEEFQFHTNLSLFDRDGKEVMRKMIIELEIEPSRLGKPIVADAGDGAIQSSTSLGLLRHGLTHLVHKLIDTS